MMIRSENMKRIIFILVLAFLSLPGFAQKPAHTDTIKHSDSTQADSTIADHGEAGGIDATQVAQDNKETVADSPWVGMLAGAAVAIGAFVLGRYVSSRKKKTGPVQEQPETEISTEESAKASSKTFSAADIKKLKDEIKQLKLKLTESQNETQAYKTNLDVYTDFDQKYYNEAFRKLVSPMNDAMERGSRKEIIENMLKITSHFNSLTRYKISKKQPYDEANMQYLMNQKMRNDVAVEIDKNTPVDKIPKNIKTLVDLLSEQSSAGLDDSIIAGYKIKNL
jgi:hypothetical protein